MSGAVGTPEAEGRPVSPRRRPLLANPFFWGAVGGVVAVTALTPLLRRVPPPPPVIAQLPAFSLVDQQGKPFGSAELRGRVYVANFFFTSCTTICPKLSRAMRKLQRRYDELEAEVALVSISVDPQTDQPARLRRYARRFGADHRRWTFLTAPTIDPIRELAVEGFKSHLGDRDDGAAMEIAHSGSLMLVDRLGRLRGTYPSDEMGLEEVVHRSVHVLLEREP